MSLMISKLFRQELLQLICYFNTIKNEISLFLITWMFLEGIMLSEICQAEKNKYFMISLIHEI